MPIVLGTGQTIKELSQKYCWGRTNDYTPIKWIRGRNYKESLFFGHEKTRDGLPYFIEGTDQPIITIEQSNTTHPDQIDNSIEQKNNYV
jgi:hypothetical protein